MSGNRTYRAGFLVAAALALALHPARGQALNALTPDEAAAGWKLLFNGASNAGWVTPGGSAGTWPIAESALTSTGGDLCTQDDYQDFDFTTDYKYGANGNSGIFFRAERGVTPVYRSAIEIAIQDNGRAGNLHKEGDAAVYGIKAPGVDEWTGPGTWNTQRIRVAGSRLEVFHNGTQVIDLDMASEEWAALVKDSKFSDGTWPIWGREAKGPICLQDHGYPILFRNIKVMVLPVGAGARPGERRGGLSWEIQGAGAQRRLAVDAPGGGEVRLSLLDPRGREALVALGRGPRTWLPLGRIERGIYWLVVTTPAGRFERRIALF